MTNTQNSRLSLPHIAPGKQGLYDPAFEHDACGVGFVAHIRAASHQAGEISCPWTIEVAMGLRPTPVMAPVF